MFYDKLEHCPECREELTQAGYDGQFCACGWAWLTWISPNTKTRDFTVNEALRIADGNSDAYKDIPSVSRVLAKEVRRLRALVQE